MPFTLYIPLASGSFLITPNVGLMIWTIVVFAISLAILRRWIFPVIGKALDARAKKIDGDIDAAEQTRQKADEVLEEYRERLAEARQQAEEIVQRARQSAEAHGREARTEAEERREQLLEQTRRDIQAETRRAIEEIRAEVANLTVLATEKVTRKTLTQEDQQRLVADALSELDFTVLSEGARQ
jgi:F-type H+-transporting ATPase subunit b